MATPHDSIVKSLFSNIEDAASALASALPKDIAQRIDWKSLQHANLKLVDRKLREFHSDIVFTARIDGRQVFLYVLLEHQSTNDKLMAFRMLRYIVLLWDALVRNTPDLERLPAVLPFVLHHGTLTWTSPVRLFDLIDLPDDVLELLGQCIPNFSFFLDDLSATDDATLRTRSLTTLMRAGLVLLKKAPHCSDLLADLGDWVDVFVQVSSAQNGLDALRLLLEYISQASDAPDHNVRQFAKLIGPSAERIYMSAAEELTQKGREQGLKEGLKEGQAGLLLRLLARKFGPIPEQVTERVRSASEQELKLWADRVLTATSLGEVLSTD